MALIGTIETEVGPAGYHIVTARISYKFGGVKIVVSAYFDEERRGPKNAPPPSKPMQQWEIVYSEYPEADVPSYTDCYLHLINNVAPFNTMSSDEGE